MLRDGQEELPEPKPVTIEDVQQVFILIDRYWTAVKNAFPQAWQDRTNYILLQTIGLTAFSKLGADVIQNQVYEAESYEQHDFDVALQHLSTNISLRREDFPGLAGLSGAKQVYLRLKQQ